MDTAVCSHNARDTTVILMLMVMLIGHVSTEDKKITMKDTF